jgi:transmembrane sensor
MSESPREHVEQASRLDAAGHWLLELKQDALTERQLSEWIAWCEADPKNLAAFEELQALWLAAGEHLPTRRPRSVSGKRVLQARIPLWTALAASIALVAVASSFILRPRPQPGQAITNVDLIQTPVAANRQTILPDGSHVEIGARTIVDVDFSAALRRLQLREGEAFFRVKHDQTRPFVVDAGELRIVAVGTAFNVRRSRGEVAVTVAEGIVEVSGGSAPAIQAHPGEQLLFRDGGVQRSLIDPGIALAWRAGRLEFTGDSLESVVANVNRYSQRPIVLADPTLAELTFTGTVFVNSIDSWLDGLQQVFPVVVDRDGAGEIRIAPR